MRRFLLGALLTALLAGIGSAPAKPGHEARRFRPPVVSGALPTNLVAGGVWEARFTFPDLEPGNAMDAFLRLTDEATGKEHVTQAGSVGAGTYFARVLFPAAGRYRIEIVTYGESWPAGRATVGAAAVPVAASEFPTIPVTGVGLAVVGLAALGMIRLRRSH